jgi:hypothetical protein
MSHVRLQPEKFWQDIPAEPGIYKICVLNDNGTAVPLNRLIGTDPRGILYIGEGQNLRERLRMLWRVITPGYNATAHTCGINYKEVAAIQRIFPLSMLAVDYQVASNHRILEKQMIEDYRQQFGEVPPLNGRK